MKHVSLFLILSFSISCSKKEKEIIPLHFEKDLIPEGIAIDSAAQTIFLSSLRHNKIVKCNLDGSSPIDFIKSNQFNYLAGFGMTVKGDTLFALGNSLPKTKSRSVLLLLNKNTGALINSYSPSDTTFKYLNDLAVSSNGDVFITDSESNKIYALEHTKGVIGLYLESDDIMYSNGIAISDDEKYLYLASYAKGIRIVDRATKTIVNDSNLDDIGIDGMKYYKNSLIAIVNSKAKTENGVYRFFMNKENSSITRKEKLVSFQEDFDVPTTFAILDGYLYFTMNSQLHNYDGDANRIIDSTKLVEYRMMKLKIQE